MLFSTRTRALVAATLLATSGCSLAFVNAPPSGPIASAEPSECTPWRVAAGTDLVGAVGFSLASYLFLPTDPSCTGWFCRDLDDAKRKTSLVLAGAGALALVSAVHGFERSGKCDRLLGWVRACDGGDGAACLRLGRPAPFPSP